MSYVQNLMLLYENEINFQLNVSIKAFIQSIQSFAASFFLLNDFVTVSPLQMYGGQFDLAVL